MKISRLKLAGLLAVMLAAFLMATPATFAASPAGYMAGSTTTTSTKHKKKAVHKKATHKKTSHKKTTHKKTAHKEKATHEKTSEHAKTTSHKRSEHHAKAGKASTKSKSTATTKHTSHAKSTAHHSERSVATSGGNGKVWVNTDSKVYHCPGSKLSGNTKQGEYMSESQAKAKGYRPSNGRACGSH